MTPDLLKAKEPTGVIDPPGGSRRCPSLLLFSSDAWVLTSERSSDFNRPWTACFTISACLSENDGQ